MEIYLARELGTYTARVSSHGMTSTENIYNY